MTQYYDQSTVAGGAGTDTVRVTNGAYATLASTSVLTGIEIWDGDGTSIRGASGDNVLDFSSITLVNVAYIDGQSGNDSIVGNAADNDLRGDYGNDTLIGGLRQ